MTGYKKRRKPRKAFSQQKTQGDREVIIWLNLSRLLLVTKSGKRKMRLTNKTRSVHWVKMIDSLSLGIFISISRARSPNRWAALRVQILRGTFRGRIWMIKKRMPWVLLAAGRDLRVHLISEFLSSSEMTVCSLPPAPAGACSGLSSGPWRPGSSLPGCLPPSCCQWGATSPTVPPFNTVHCMLRQRRSSALEEKKNAFELHLQMLQLEL